MGTIDAVGRRRVGFGAAAPVGRETARFSTERSLAVDSSEVDARDAGEVREGDRGLGNLRELLADTG